LTPLVRGGADHKHGKGAHTLLTVHREMHLQICRDYPALPDPRTLTFSEIRYFYEGLRLELRERTKAT
jgi:hypothetical protein